ncbi:flavin reductase family protein [Corynebacterium heidelbergense]|uniref:Flavin reductase n=1 Tax=Corynebacterium heidelbergense TaxID=2055947 RepID=A0A364V3A4_9CORY|nr:flavin reductase family protein [Corynebacterium heidelbergense]RAV31109.1 flavin reductase [Corynebacterium heidelbergense]
MPDTESLFRAAFRAHPAGVSIITATVDSQPFGLTASSVSSLSLDPIAVSFSLMKRTGSAGKLLAADTFLIHLLTAGQAAIAAAFARPDGPRFTPDQGWSTAETGEPLLPAARAVLRARTMNTIRSGPATLVAAEVLGVTLNQNADAHFDPLVYKNHRFFSLRRTPPLASE